MVLGREVIGRGTVPEVDVLDDADSLELLKVAIDGREVDVRCEAVDGLGEFLRRSVSLALEETAQEESP